MEEKKFMKGCEAVAEAAIRAGCRFYAGYPITPQNDVPEYFSRRMPQVGGVFLQGESEVASANMLYAGAVSGTRSMTTSSSCGISLMSEAISWMAMNHLPAVIGNFQRGGPGIGSIKPSQQDYFQATKAHGNGGFQMLVLAPSTLQEAADMTYEAFDLADKYSFPVYLLLDGFTGTMMETVTMPPMKSDEEVAAIKASKTWVPRGREKDGSLHGQGMMVSRIDMNRREAEMYEQWKRDEVRWEEYLTEDAELIITSYGISARIARSVVTDMRKEGYKVGLIRPIRVNPFPVAAYEKLDFAKLRGILCTEMSIPALFAVDVQNVVHGRTPIDTALSSGGEIITADAIYEAAVKMYGNK